jgi:CDP-diacylglycerol---serine O-phosphatidyltransferase
MIKFIKNNLANALSLGNLFSGAIGCIAIIEGQWATTALCILASLVLDFLDGFVARALKADSDLGGQLDSLADVISFGLLPGLGLYEMMSALDAHVLGLNIKYIGLLVAVFSGLRLAIFNLDTEQKYYFKGLNTPSNTMLIFGLIWAYQQDKSFGFLIENPWLMIALSLLSAWLLVSPIKMLAFKFKQKDFASLLPVYLLLGGALLLLLMFGFAGIPMAIIYYILISLLFQRKIN